MSSVEKDANFLRIALTEAEKRRGFCAPNPAVGALVVKDGKILAQGHHKKAGMPHAEVEALNQLGDEAEGSTVYVTLEPCCHTGKRTPPCTDLLIHRKVGRVVYGHSDPNPQVAGKGSEILRAKGISCEALELSELKDFYQSYSYWTRTGLPFVTTKLALSLDGKVAGENGKPVKLTSAQIDGYTHEQRLHSDAILTTARTVLRDDPQLNARVGSTVTPKRVFILDSRLETPLTAKITRSAERLYLFYAEDASPLRLKCWQEKGVELFPIPQVNSQLDLVQAVQAIGASGVHDLWVEAGGTLVHELMRRGLISRALFYITPHVLGSEATSAFPSAISKCVSSGTKQIWRIFGNDACLEIQWPQRTS